MFRLIAALFLIPCAGAAMASRSITIDPVFPYYKDRSTESVVEEIKANDYDDVRMACVNESGINGDLVKALKAAGIRVWMLTFVNGTYSTADLPKGWEAWRMKLRKTAEPDGFVYLCLNNPAYAEWKRHQLTTALAAHPFHGVDLVEPFFPAYKGPDSELYGCLCDHCVAAFKKMCPEAEAPPDFSDRKSPRYWKTDGALYEKWVGFRVASVIGFLDDLVNGKDGIREKCPDTKIATWSLGLDVPDQIAKLREWEAIDGAAIVRRVKPDMHVIQTDWPDWTRPDLPDNYPLKYKAIADAIHDASPKTPLMLQADIGSKQPMRRGREWIKQVEKTAKDIHCQSTTHYEYHLGQYMYTEPPAVVRTEWKNDTIKLVFSKRLDPMTASNISSYSLSPGRVDFARVDGNIVLLTVSGSQPGATLTISGLSDDEARRYFHDKPACTIPDNTQIVID